MEQTTKSPLKQETGEDPQRKTRWRRLWEWMGFGEKGEKTGLDLIQVVAALSIPVVAAILTAYVTMTQGTAAETAENVRKETDIAVETERARNQLQAEESRATNEALQSYLDDMTNLMLREVDDPTQMNYIKELKRARTLTILTRLNRDQENKAKSKRSVLQFLYEAGWIQAGNEFFDMSGTDLSGGDLSGLTLEGTDLRNVILDDADLSDANLRNSWVTQAQLDSTQSLAGTTMPDGSKYE